jgi:hypothetical protein
MHTHILSTTVDGLRKGLINTIVSVTNVQIEVPNLYKLKYDETGLALVKHDSTDDLVKCIVNITSDFVTVWDEDKKEHSEYYYEDLSIDQLVEIVLYLEKVL